MLQNRLYIGQTTHKGAAYPGEHDAIVDPAIFETTQAQLKRNRIDRIHNTHAGQPSPLAGILWDGQGRRMSPSHAVKQSKRYRYHVSRAEQDTTGQPVWRVPVGDLEALVVGRLRAFLLDPGAVHDVIAEAAPDAVAIEETLLAARILADRLGTETQSELRRRLLEFLQRIEVHRERVDLQVDPEAVRLLGSAGSASPVEGKGGQRPFLLSTPAKLARIGKGLRLIVAPAHGASTARRDLALIKLIVKVLAARTAVEQRPHEGLEALARSQQHARDYFGVLLRLSYLAPDITAAILDGRQPQELTRQKLARAAGIPLDWAAQREVLGFDRPGISRLPPASS